VEIRSEHRDRINGEAGTGACAEEALFDPPYLVVRSSPINRQGLFSTKKCRPGEVLMIISGEVIDAQEAQRREIEEANFYIYWHGDDVFVDPPVGAKSRYPNHSCQPNALTEARNDKSLNLVALHDVACGEEITLDYEYDGIYELCREVNPLCLRAMCPLVNRSEDLR
jgi:hypothetical protein